MIGLVHLVWAPLGPEPVREFVRSYHAHPSGAEHALTIVLNGTGRPGSGGEGSGVAADRARAALLAELKGTDHRVISLERPVLDLAAYGEAARRLEHERVCFLNSYSVILADDWLGLLAAALEDESVGLVGASASWESQAEWVRGRVRHWPRQLVGLPRARRDYPRFPNPHIRTNAFMLDRRSLVEMGLERAAEKRATYLLEERSAEHHSRRPGAGLARGGRRPRRALMRRRGVAREQHVSRGRAGEPAGRRQPDAGLPAGFCAPAPAPVARQLGRGPSGGRERRARRGVNLRR